MMTCRWKLLHESQFVQFLFISLTFVDNFAIYYDIAFLYLLLPLPSFIDNFFIEQVQENEEEKFVRNYAYLCVVIENPS